MATGLIQAMTGGKRTIRVIGRDDGPRIRSVRSALPPAPEGGPQGADGRVRDRHRHGKPETGPGGGAAAATGVRFGEARPLIVFDDPHDARAFTQKAYG